MDALEFLTERRRMCNLYAGCFDCPLADIKCIIRDITSDEDCKKIIDTVEKWSKENPRKTRQSVFLEQWPEAQLENDGVLTVCPSTISSTHRSQYGGCGMRSTPCSDCCREFWMQEVE